jgi:hypothetical protein
MTAINPPRPVPRPAIKLSMVAVMTVSMFILAGPFPGYQDFSAAGR